MGIKLIFGDKWSIDDLIADEAIVRASLVFFDRYVQSWTADTTKECRKRQIKYILNKMRDRGKMNILDPRYAAIKEYYEDRFEVNFAQYVRDKVTIRRAR
jgi:hypothetical protein